MGRFRVLPADQLPVTAMFNACAITLSGPEVGERWLDIDFGVDDATPNGDLFVREAIVREWGALMGMVDATELSALEAQIDACERELEAAREELGVAQQFAESLLKFAPERAGAPSVVTTGGKR